MHVLWNYPKYTNPIHSINLQEFYLLDLEHFLNFPLDLNKSERNIDILIKTGLQEWSSEDIP